MHFVRMRIIKVGGTVDEVEASQGGVTSAHAVGRSATAVKVLTWVNFTLTLDLQCLSSLTCDLSVSCRTFDLHLFLYFPIRTCACNLV